MIRATLAAAPRPRQVLAAKALVLTGTLFVVGPVTAFVGYLGGNWFLDRAGHRLALPTTASLRALFGSGLYLAGLGLFAVALGLLMRHTAAVLSIGSALVLSSATWPSPCRATGVSGWPSCCRATPVAGVATPVCSTRPAQPVDRLRGLRRRGRRPAAGRLVVFRRRDA